MSNKNTKFTILNNYLTTKNFTPVSYHDFYYDIFKDTSLAAQGSDETGKYRGIIVEIEKGKRFQNHFYIHSDFKTLKILESSTKFLITAPITYAGGKRNSTNARELSAIAIDLDHIIINEENSTCSGLDFFFNLVKASMIPNPTYMCCSGSGIHLYYCFQTPIKLFPNVKEQLSIFKKELTRWCWYQGGVTQSSKSVQYESLVQGFRAVGSICKDGVNRVTAYLTGKKYTMEELNSYFDEAYRVKYYNSHRVDGAPSAKDKWPLWYQKRIVEARPKEHWVANRHLYDWWKKKILTSAKVGHRYYCIFCLTIYAMKCNIPYEELESDAYFIGDFFQKTIPSETDPFTPEDVKAALQAYQPNYITFPINSIKFLSSIDITKNKRNGRAQKTHIERMSVLRDHDYPDGSWRNTDGRPKGSKDKAPRKVSISKKQLQIKEFRLLNPGASKADCIRQLNIDRKTVSKYWDS